MSRQIFSGMLLAWTIACVPLSAAEPDPNPPKISNVLMIVADDLKAGVLGCYGDEVCQTPNLDRLAQQGMTFHHAYCQATWCHPSRVSFMHGRYSDQSNPTLGEHLRGHGVETVRVGKIFHMRVPGDIIAGTDGKDVPQCWTRRFNSPGPEAHTTGEYACLNLNVFTREMENRQSTRMPHRMFVSVRTDTDGAEQADYKSASKAVELLSGLGENPFFLAVGLVRPHYPMVAPEEFFTPYPIERIRMPGNWHDDVSDIPPLGLAATRNERNAIGNYPDNQKRMWSAYYASVSFMDRQVGRILDALESSPLADNTSVIFTSDHGYHLGEHGFWQKSNLHEQVIRVPLIVRVPGMKPGQTRSIAELVDLYPTICDLMGRPIPDAAQGTSLTPILADPGQETKPEAFTIHQGHSLRSKRWHYMRYRDGTEELYDMDVDPDETTNLADDSHRDLADDSHRQTLNRLRERLDYLIERNSQR